MKFREHPLLANKWPPSWIWVGGQANKKPAGEVGTLVRVMLSQLVPAKMLFLFIDFEESEYVGSLSSVDADSCRKIYSFLQHSVGSSLALIGSMDITSFL
jgi:hypothetical protein